jgi:flavin reductase (DIM6/NTAB) family NADH-FMN oxidoreductase RutF
MLDAHKQTFVVDELAGADGYKLSSGLVVPRPIGWIGTLSSAGVPNLAPYSFFNCVSGNPPTFVFSPGREGRRDTLANVREVPEFTINIVSEEVAAAMNSTAATVAADVDEFELAGVTACPSTQVRPPMVGECKANIECRVVDIVDIGDPGRGNSLVIGEAVVFHVASRLLDGTRVDQAELAAIGRHVGSFYSRTRDLFEMKRPL